MRRMRIFVFVIPMLGFGLYCFQQRSVSEVAAASMVANTFAPSWSNNEDVISSMEEKVRQEPGNATVHALLGQAYLQRARESGDPGYYTKAEILFERALKTQPGSIEAMLGKASLLMARHNFLEARDLAMKAVEANPDVVATYGVLTDALVELGEYDKAIQSLQAMVEKKPNLSSYSRVSYIRELKGDVDGAIQAMKMAIDSGAPHAENTAWCMVQLGNLYLNKGVLDQAASTYEAALARFPDYAHAFAGLARVAEARGNLALAVEHYKRAMDRVPLAEFAMGMSRVYTGIGRNDEARQQFDLVDAIQRLYEANGVSMDIEMALFNADRGKNLEQALKVAESEWLLRKSVRVADVYAWTLYRVGRIEEARQMMRQALRLGTRDPLFLRHAEAIAQASSF